MLSQCSTGCLYSQRTCHCLVCTVPVVPGLCGRLWTVQKKGALRHSEQTLWPQSLQPTRQYECPAGGGGGRGGGVVNLIVSINNWYINNWYINICHRYMNSWYNLALYKRLYTMIKCSKTLLQLLYLHLFFSDQVTLNSTLLEVGNCILILTLVLYLLSSAITAIHNN